MSWPFVTLGSLEGGKGNFVDGPFGSNLKSSEYTESGVPLIQLKNIKPNKYITKDLKFVSQEKADSISRHSYKSGDVCIAKLGAVGTACIIPDDAPDGIIVADVVRFRGDKSLIDYKYFCHFLNSPEGQRRVLALSRGSTRTRTNLTDLKKVEIPLPPLDEQKRIAAILDKADAIRRKRQRAIQLADDFLRSVFLDMFGDPVTNPKGWEVKKIKDFTSVTTGNTPSRKIPEYYGSDLEWIKSDNINTPNHTLTQSTEYLSSEGEKVARTVEKGSILITCIAGSFDCIGNVAFADRKVAFNQQINALTPKYEYVTEWFLYSLILFGKKVIQNASTNSMKGMVSKGKLENVEMILPPLEKQKEFEEFFNKQVSIISKMNVSYSNSANNFNSISQKAFAGEL